MKTKHERGRNRARGIEPYLSVPQNLQRLDAHLLLCVVRAASRAWRAYANGVLVRVVSVAGHSLNSHSEGERAHFPFSQLPKTLPKVLVT